MAFEIGETVTPSVNINFNGTEVPTQGKQGVVISRQDVGQDTEGGKLYTYQVQLSEVVTFGEPESQQSGQVFWFSESDLGNTQTATSSTLDEGTVSTSVANGKSSTESSTGTITQLTSAVPTVNPYHDTLKNYEAAALSNVEILSSSTINTSVENDLARKGNALVTQSEQLSTDTEIMKELSENVYGFYTITSEIESEIKQEQLNAELQESLAQQDDQQTFDTFVSSFIDNDTTKGLLVPDTENAGQGVIGDIEDLDEINPADLITEPLDLEQD